MKNPARHLTLSLHVLAEVATLLSYLLSCILVSILARRGVTAFVVVIPREALQVWSGMALPCLPS